MAGHKHLHADEHALGQGDELLIESLGFDSGATDGQVLKVYDSGGGVLALAFDTDDAGPPLIQESSAANCHAAMTSAKIATAIWEDTSTTPHEFWMVYRDTDNSPGTLQGVQMATLYTVVA